MEIMLAPLRKWVDGFGLAACIVLAIGGVVTLCGLFAQPPGRDPAPDHRDIAFAPTVGGREIVFVGRGEGVRDLYRLDLRTGTVTAIARTPEFEQDPAVSPDGRLLAYAATVPGEQRSRIYIRSLAGGEARPLTGSAAPGAEGTPVSDARPAFSPDGRRIAFARAHRLEALPSGPLWTDWDLYVVEVSGGEPRRLTEQRYLELMSPAWSTREERLLYAAVPASGRGRRSDLYEVALAGGEPRPLTQDGRSYLPAASSDGMRIAFVAEREPGRGYQIWVAGPDLTGARAVTASPDYKARPRFSPDGSEIFFLAAPSPGGALKLSLWRLRLADGSLTRVAPATLFDSPLAGAPGGTAADASKHER